MYSSSSYGSNSSWSAQQKTNSSVMSVGELIALINKKLSEKDIAPVTIEGDIVDYSGPAKTKFGNPWYKFSLKDPDGGAKIGIKVFSTASIPADLVEMLHTPTKVERGKSVYELDIKLRITGKLDMYAPWGTIQLSASSVSIVGGGQYIQRLKILEKKLIDEGVINPLDSAGNVVSPPPHKCAIPEVNNCLYERVAVITSANGDAVNDFKASVSPLVSWKLYPTLVEGEKAPASIVEQLKLADAENPDCIVLTRGGGSDDSLFTFNDERVVRAIAACKAPVLCAIGHARNVTLAERAANARFITPTQCAERVAPSAAYLKEVLAGSEQQLNKALKDAIFSRKVLLDHSVELLRGNMSAYLGRQKDQLEVAAQNPYLTSYNFIFEKHKESLEANEAYLFDSMQTYLERLKTNTVDRLSERLTMLGPTIVANPARQLETLDAKLQAYSPYDALRRGYAIIKDEQAHIVRDVSEIEVGQHLNMQLNGGSFEAEVSAVKRD